MNTFTTSNKVQKIYINGSFDKTRVSSANYNSGGNHQASIGSGIFNGNTTWFRFEGKISDVRIYNRALSATEITTIYNITRSDFATNFAIQSNPSVNVNYIPVESKIFTSDKGFTDHKGKLITKPHTVRQDALVGWWKLDEGYGDKAFDSSGNGNIGTKNSAPLWTNDSEIGLCLDFDGINDYISLGNNTLDLSNGFTYSAWVYWDTNSDWSGIFDLGNGLNKDNILFLDMEQLIIQIFIYIIILHYGRMQYQI